MPSALIALLLAAAYASEPMLGAHACAWTALIGGVSWLLRKLPKWDPYLLVDTAHAVLALYTLTGKAGLEEHTLLLLHMSYHVCLVTLIVAIEGRATAFSNHIFVLYFAASWVMLLADRAIRAIDPAAEDAALKTTLTAADVLTTPWHWCLYNLVGCGDRLVMLPCIGYTAYCSARVLYTVIPAMRAAGTAVLATKAVSSAPPLVGWLVILVPAFNCIIAWPVLIPRIQAFFAHVRRMVRSASKPAPFRGPVRYSRRTRAA